MKQRFKTSERINIDNLKDPITQKNFAPELNQKLTQNHVEHVAPNKAWKTVAMTCQQTAKAIPGVMKPSKIVNI